MSETYEWEAKEVNRIEKDKRKKNHKDILNYEDKFVNQWEDFLVGKKITFEWNGERFFGTVIQLPKIGTYTEKVPLSYGRSHNSDISTITELVLKDVYIRRNCNKNVIWEHKETYSFISSAKDGIEVLHEISENDLLQIQEALNKQTEIACEREIQDKKRTNYKKLIIKYNEGSGPKIYDLKNIFRTLSELKKGDENYNLITTNLPHWLKENSFLTKYREALTHLQHFWTTFDAKNYTDKVLWTGFDKAANSGYPWKDGEKLTINKTTKKFNISSGQFEDLQTAATAGGRKKRRKTKRKKRNLKKSTRRRKRRRKRKTKRKKRRSKRRK